MDAKILRAAVSAAIRVTVSTTLIGCGGQSTTDVAGGVAATGGITATSEGKSSPRPSQRVTPDYPKSEPASGGKPSAVGGAASGGAIAAGSAPNGGVVSGGGTAEAGESNPGEANGGAPTATCGANLDACFVILDSIDRAAPLAGAAKACCQTVFDDLLSSAADGSVACANTRARLRASPAFWPCCETGLGNGQADSWMRTGCTPWGPPVPPELALEALFEWENAA